MVKSGPGGEFNASSADVSLGVIGLEAFESLRSHPQSKRTIAGEYRAASVWGSDSRWEMGNRATRSGSWDRGSRRMV